MGMVKFVSLQIYLLWLLSAVEPVCKDGTFGRGCKLQCHCHQNRSCDATTGACGRCEEGWSGPMCQRLNIALGKHAEQNGTEGENFAKKGVDGNRNRNCCSSCIHTAQQHESPPWWIVNLEKTFEIYHMTIYNRAENEWIVNLQSFEVNVQDASNQSKLCYVHNVSTSFDVLPFHCKIPMKGQYVRVNQNNNNPMVFCELEVYECSNFTFGDSCQHACRCKNDAEICDKVSGHCPSGCLAGWQGSDCQQECSNFTFGDSCQHACRCKNDAEICDKVSGHCPSGCLAGWQGSDCQQECSNFTFGDSCQHACRCKNDAEICDKVSGHCPSGCLAGWQGSDCQQECFNFTFGDSCQHACRCKNDAEICDKVSGHCPSGCLAGWQGSDCQQECSNFTFGDSCQHVCRCKNDAEICDKVNGHCPSGCPAGWQGSDCQQECSNFTFGDSCQHACRCKNDAEICDKVSGHCPSGCLAGWQGSDCQQVLSKRPLFMNPLFWSLLVVLLLIIILIAVVCICRKRADTRTTDDNYMPDKDDSNEMIHKKPSALVQPLEGIKKSSSDVRTAELVQYLTNKINSPLTMESEFKRLPQGLTRKHNAGTKVENRAKNRFKNIKPYDHSRVVLTPYKDDPNSDYINASYIDGSEGLQRYIAAQGPTNELKGDFWRMVWQTQCTKIVMLTILQENGKVKCARYWPEAGEISLAGITIRLVSEDKYADFVVRKLLLTMEYKTRTVYHFHFTSWPDKCAPNIPTPLLIFHHKIHSTYGTGPLLVHCSAGIGRTGTFLALDCLIKQGKIERCIQIFGTVYKMRQQRVGLIQTLKQYVFLHVALSEALLYSGPIIYIDEFPKYYLSWTNHRGKSGMTHLKEEFEKLKQCCKPAKDRPDFETAKSDQNKVKNRDLNILASDRFRPFLSTLVSDHGMYVNAVFLSSYRKKNAFFVTQYPLQETIIDFWQLVYELSVKSIVMLDVEENMKNIFAYWPVAERSCDFGPFHVEKLSRVQEDGFSILTLECTFEQIYQCDFWKKGKVPSDVGLFLTLLQTLQSAAATTSDNDSAIIVQCLNGADKSGLFCAVWNIIERAQDDGYISVNQAVRLIQFVRQQFVQTLEQYQFCYDAVYTFLQKKLQSRLKH